MTSTQPQCSCTKCPGRGCACGCNAPMAAMPPACDCGAACQCDAAASGCLCG